MKLKFYLQPKENVEELNENVMKFKHTEIERRVQKIL